MTRKPTSFSGIFYVRMGGTFSRFYVFYNNLIVNLFMRMLYSKLYI